MLIDTTEVLKDYDGDDLIDAKGRPLTVKVAMGMALNTLGQGENPSPEEKLEIGHLTRILYDGPTAEITAAQLTLIRKRSGLMSFPIVHLQISEILDRAEQLTSVPPPDRTIPEE